MTVSEIEDYAKRMLAVAETGGSLPPELRAQIVTAAIHSCGAPTNATPTDTTA